MAEDKPKTIREKLTEIFQSEGTADLYMRCILDYYYRMVGPVGTEGQFNKWYEELMKKANIDSGIDEDDDALIEDLSLLSSLVLVCIAEIQVGVQGGPINPDKNGAPAKPID